MESAIGKLCKSVGKFCNHLDHSSAALTESVDRRPIPLDSASTTFVQSVNRRVSSASSDLNMLESMSFSTVSFEELLGYCYEVLNKNQNDLSNLLLHHAPLDFDDDDDEEEAETDRGSDNNLTSFELKNNDIIAQEDPLLDESLSLKHFGISDVSLANIASQADEDFDVDEPDSLRRGLEVIEGNKRGEMVQYEDPRHLLQVSRDDFESLPKHMKSLASWEDLLVAVEKMNSCIGTKKMSTFWQDEIESVGLGFKTRSYLLLLIKMNRLCVETSDGVICYRIL